MVAVCIFGITLIVAVLLSGLARRSVLSLAVLFLGVGFISGDGVLGLISFEPSDQMVSKFAEFALFSVLFTDGMRVGLRDLAATWHLPGRALLLGMPLTFLGTAVLAHVVVGLQWAEAFLVGAVLSPTDPVFAAAIVGRDEIPAPLRRLLNVESGLNDGLALPVVVAMLVLVGARDASMAVVLGEVVLGIVLGVAVPWLAIRLEHSRFFSAARIYEPLHAFAVGLVVLALASLTHANEFLAAFAAGITMATAGPQLQEAFHAFGEIVTELLKLAALLVFGVLISFDFLVAELNLSGYLFAIMVLLVVRPLAFGLALLGSDLNWRERVTAAWFGPKGFASVVLGLMIWKSGAAGAEQLFHLVALAITLSITAHSSTDILIARWFRSRQTQTHHCVSRKAGGQPTGFRPQEMDTDAFGSQG